MSDSTGADVGWAGLVRPLVQALQEEAPSIATETADQILRRFPAYGSVGESVLIGSAHANIVLAISVIRDRRRASDEEVRRRAELGGERARQSVPVDAVLSAFGMTMGLLRDRLLELGHLGDVSASVLLEATQIAWSLAEDVTIAISMSHREAERVLARGSESLRAEFLRQLLTGSPLPSEMLDHVPIYGLDQIGRYRALRARGKAQTVEALIQALESTHLISSGAPGLFGVIDGDVVGIVSDVPQLDVPATVGIGGLASLTELKQSFVTASRAFDTALLFGMTGVFALNDLMLRAAVVRDFELGNLLSDRYLGCLNDDDDFARILKQTLRTYLSFGQQVNVAADALNVHPNTLRYRLRRYEEVADAAIADGTSAMELWWALEWDLLNLSDG